MQVALSGSSGTGKTTLGQALAKQLELPFVEEGMRKRLENGLDTHALDNDGWRALIWDLWREQSQAEAQALNQAKGFVADRSSLDFAAFWLHYGLYDDPVATEEFIETMVQSATRYGAVFLFPWGALPLEHDGIRADNRWLQLRFQSLVESLQRRYLKTEQLRHIPATQDFEARLSFALDSLQR